MFRFWINYRLSGVDPGAYHATNVLLHFLTSVVVTLILARLLEWADVSGKARAVLSVLGGGVFLVHPVQTESVAYVYSRSEPLSVLLYFAAFALFLYRPPGSITISRCLAIAALAAGAIGTKEHALTLLALLALTDL